MKDGHNKKDLVITHLYWLERRPFEHIDSYIMVTIHNFIGMTSAKWEKHTCMFEILFKYIR